MDTKTIHQFIDKAISKTKSNNLSWKCWNPDFRLKSLPGENDPYVANVFDSHQLALEDSYITSYKTGHLLLLVYKPSMQIFPCNPPENCTLSLRMQDDSSKFPIEIANSSIDSVISTSLIRLYNLVVENSSSVNTLINDFLNS